MKPEFRVYGTVRGLDEDAARALAATLPIPGARWTGGVLDIDFEGPWADHEAVAAAIAAALPPGGTASLDAIDDGEWTVTRYVIAPGRVAARTIPINDVLDAVRTS